MLAKGCQSIVLFPRHLNEVQNVGSVFDTQNLMHSCSVQSIRLLPDQDGTGFRVS